MRRLAFLMLASPAALVGAALAAPGWVERGGLDVWNVGKYGRLLREAEDRSRELEEVAEAGRHRNAVIEQAGRRLYCGSLSLPQAAGEVLAVCSPEWLAVARDTHIRMGRLPAGASDRDVAVQLVLIWVEGMRREAVATGDVTAVEEIDARLDDLATEARALVRVPGPTARAWR